MRVPDCGHATVAAFGILAQRGRFKRSTTKRTIAGPRAIHYDDDGVLFMQQLPSRFEAGPDPRTIAASLGLSEATAFSSQPAVARHDVAFLLVPLPHVGTDVFGYYVFASTGDSEFDATVRMFAPRIGILEESATGMAAGMLGAYLHDRAGRKASRFTFDQGSFMRSPSPSRLSVVQTLENGVTTEVWVGGRARARSTCRIEA